MHLVYTRMPRGSHRRRRLRSLLLCLCDVFRAVINSLVCCKTSWRMSWKNPGQWAISRKMTRQKGQQGSVEEQEKRQDKGELNDS